MTSKHVDNLLVIGKSPFSSYCDNDINDSRYDYHANCLTSSSYEQQNSNDIFIPTSNSCWFLNDHHMDDNELKIYRSLKTVDKLGQQLNSIRYDQCEKPVDVITKIDVDDMAKKYFPVTLGTAAQIDAQIKSDKLPSWTLTFSPPPTGLPRQSFPWRVPTMHNKNELNRKWIPSEKYLVQNLNFMASLPNLSASKMDIDQLGLIHTPYQSELAKLRLDRLRLEDEILMEVKRQEELERIRGPEPKWYELRDATFHYEARKNNELLKSCDNWQNLFDYRSTLKKKSEEFQQKYYPENKSYDPTNYIPVT